MTCLECGIARKERRFSMPAHNDSKFVVWSGERNSAGKGDPGMNSTAVVYVRTVKI